MIRTATHRVPALLAALLLAGLAVAQGDRTDAGLSREQMWAAPTAEDWQKPVLIQWQRTWEDAVALAQQTRQPILVCINMDGEIASEHYAGIRYRQPEIAALYEPYVCVIASVYRHNPRDHDEHGERIPCPRFGGVTCGEHIAIEPILFEKFMDGRRIAPRHIMVELDGSETYDVFYAFDTASVFQNIREGITGRTIQAPPVVRGDRSLLERVASPDSHDRAAVEQAWQQGDAALRKALMDAAVAQGDQAPVEILRLGLFGFDLDLAREARQALARTSQPGAVDLISDALRVPMPAEERSALVGALERLGESSPRARTLAVVHQGLASRSGTVDLERWGKALEGAATYLPATDAAAVYARIDRSEAAARARPDDAAARLDLAEGTLIQALDPELAAPDSRLGARFQRVLLEDALRIAGEAEQLGARGWRVDAAIAVASYHLDRLQQAQQRAEQAMGAMPADVQSRISGEVLWIFAEARHLAIVDAVRRKERWPPQWLTDLNAAYSVLARHPFGTDVHVVSHYDFLKFFGAAEAARVLEQGLERFPDSWLLHDRMRARILAEQGVAGLEPAYEAMLAKAGAAPNLRWFAGYTSLVAAEFHRRRGRTEAALQAYDRAIAHYQQAIEQNPGSRESSDHYVGVALGGKARLHLEAGALEQALDCVVASFRRAPDSASALDGLNLSTVDTAKMLLTALQQAQHADAAARLQAAMAELDPSQLQLPAYERETPPPGGVQPGGGPGRRGGRGR